MSPQNKKAYLYTSLVIFFWATIASAFKIALRYQSPSDLLYRSAFFSLVIFSIFILVKKQGKLLFGLTGRQLAKSVTLGFLNPFLYYLVLFHAYRMLPAQQAQPLNMTWGIVIALLSIPLLKQKFQLRDFIALVITYLGVLVIAFEGRILSLKFHNPLGVILALSTAFVWAIYWIANTTDPLPPLIRLFYNFFFGWLFILLYQFLFTGFAPLSPKAAASALYVGMFEFGITYVLWLQALRLIDRTVKLSILIYIVPFLSFVFISLLVGERIRISSIVGAVFIVGGILVHKAARLRQGAGN